MLLNVGLYSSNALFFKEAVTNDPPFQTPLSQRTPFRELHTSIIDCFEIFIDAPKNLLHVYNHLRK